MHTQEILPPGSLYDGCHLGSTNVVSSLHVRKLNQSSELLFPNYVFIARLSTLHIANFTVASCM